MGVRPAFSVCWFSPEVLVRVLQNGLGFEGLSVPGFKGLRV